MKNSTALADAGLEPAPNADALSPRRINCLNFSADEGGIETQMITQRMIANGRKSRVVTLVQQEANGCNVLAVEPLLSQFRVKRALQTHKPDSQREEHELANGTHLIFQAAAKEASLIIRHDGGACGDKIIFTIPLGADPQLTLNVMRGLLRSLTSEKSETIRSALEDLEEFTRMEHGSRTFEPGERRKGAAALHRRVSPRLTAALEYWEKGPGPADSGELYDFLHDGVEFETLRKRDGGTHLFPELRLALPQSHEGAGGWFALQNGEAFQVKFRLPRRKNAGAWQRLLSTVGETFGRSPESLVDAFSRAIDRESAAPFPITDDNLAAFHHVVRLYRANHKALSAQLRPLGDVRSEFAYKSGSFQVTFSRSLSLALRLGVSFSVQPEGIDSVVISGRRSIFGGTKRLRLPYQALEEEALAHAFSLFYSDDEDSLERRKASDSALFHFISARAKLVAASPQRGKVVEHPASRAGDKAAGNS